MDDNDDHELSARARARILRLTRHLPEVGTFLPKTRGPFRGPKRASSFAKKAAKNSLTRFGFAGGDVIRMWPEIAGPLAAVTKPERITKTPDGDVLILKVKGSRAPEVQSRAKELLERANQMASPGRLIRIEIIQGPLG